MSVSLIQLLVVVIVLGLLWWLVAMVLPLPAPFKMVAQVIVVLIAIVWLLSLVGLWPARMRISSADAAGDSGRTLAGVELVDVALCGLNIAPAHLTHQGE